MKGSESIPQPMKGSEFYLLSKLEELYENVRIVANLPHNEGDKQNVVSQIEEYLDAAGEYKKQLVNDGHEIAGKRILSMECAVKTWRDEIEMWADLAGGNFDSAWNHMVSAQDYAKASTQAHNLGEKIGMENRLQRLLAIEELVFPNQLFFSPGLRVGTALCSVCEEEYAQCEHLKGLVYGGEFCNLIIDEVVEADHVAIVEDPADKRARAYIAGGRDRMTGLEVEDPEIEGGSS